MYKFTLLAALACLPMLSFAEYYNANEISSFSGLLATVDSDNTDSATDNAIVTYTNKIPLMGEIISVDLKKVNATDDGTLLFDQDGVLNAATEFDKLTFSGDLADASATGTEKLGIEIKYHLNKADGARLHISLEGTDTFEFKGDGLLINKANGCLEYNNGVIITEALALSNSVAAGASSIVGLRSPTAVAGSKTTTVDDGTATEYLQIVGKDTSYASFNDEDTVNLKFVCTLVAE